jgi:hypothetical protein
MNPETIADDQHPDHQFGIDGRSAHRALELREMPPQIGEVDKAIDRAKHVIGWHVRLQTELVE